METRYSTDAGDITRAYFGFPWDTGLQREIMRRNLEWFQKWLRP